jgi:hypothetical protein
LWMPPLSATRSRSEAALSRKLNRSQSELDAATRGTRPRGRVLGEANPGRNLPDPYTVGVLKSRGGLAGAPVRRCAKTEKYARLWGAGPTPDRKKERGSRGFVAQPAYFATCRGRHSERQPSYGAVRLRENRSRNLGRDSRIRRWTDVVITPELAKLWPTSVRSLLTLADSSVGRWIPKGIPRPAEPLSFGSATSCVTSSILSEAPVPIDGLH